MGVRVTDRDRISPEELMILVERGGEQGIIEAEEEQMIGAVLGLGERKVHEVMVPRIAIVALPTTATLDQIVDTIVEGGHSRIPVYEDSVDNIVGILYAKDLLPYLKGVDQPPPVARLVRAPLFVPESMSVDDLLHSLQRRRVHIAIVLDEYGGTAGMVTIEDLLEEIVGEIQDEYDTEEPMIVPLGDDEARVDGRAAIEDLLEHFDLPIGRRRGPRGVRHGRRPHLSPHRWRAQGRRRGAHRRFAPAHRGDHRRPSRGQDHGPAVTAVQPRTPQPTTTDGSARSLECPPGRALLRLGTPGRRCHASIRLTQAVMTDPTMRWRRSMASPSTLPDSTSWRSASSR